MSTDTPPLAFIDVETTGLDLARHDIWEIGIIRRDESNADTEYVIHIRPDLSKADPGAMHVNRFYERVPADAIRPPEPGAYTCRKCRYTSRLGPLCENCDTPLDVAVNPYWTSLLDAAHQVARLTSGCHLVGIVPSFDAAFVSKFLVSHGLPPAWHYHLIDAEAMAAGSLGLPPPWQSRTISQRLGISPPDPQDAHTAIADARWAMYLFDAVTRKKEAQT